MNDVEILKSNTFLRWTGSKKWLLKELNQYLPLDFQNYHEPFLGGGSVFFYVKNNSDKKRSYFLSDLNSGLINLYEQIRDNLPELISVLKKHKNSSEFYYKIRDYKPRTNVNKAAKFMYLNRTSFNGIYRVNSKGEYNVPYGKRQNVDIVTEPLLQNVKNALKNTFISCGSFDIILENVKAKDFVFLDPPYTVSHENNGFIEYNQKLFSWDDQIALKELIKTLIERDVFFLLTNASHQSIRDLYSDIPNIKIKKISRHCKVGGRSHTRKMYNELLIYNT